MTHPLFHSRAGKILYREMPETMRHYDTRDPLVSAVGEAGTETDPVTQHVLGDLEAYLYGFGHLLDRFDATLRQLHADGFLDPVGPPNDEKSVQGWLLPYVAQLFGVDLLAPDAESRRRELSVSIWNARRRGTKTAVDVAAEMITDQQVIIVPGTKRILYAPSLRQTPMTHRDQRGLWHPKDAAILGEPIPSPPAPATHVTRYVARQGERHAGLPVGAPHSRHRMRAVEADLARPDAEVRLAQGAAPGDERLLRPFVVRARRGVPCFADSHEDRSLRTPDMRAPRVGRKPFTGLKRPDGVTIFVDPPGGFFTGQETRVPEPTVADGQLTGNGIPVPGVQADVFYHEATETLTLDATNARATDAEGTEGAAVTWTHIIEDLKFAGTVQIADGSKVLFRNCAISSVIGRVVNGGQPTVVRAQSSIFDAVDLMDFTADGSETIFEYVTVLTSTQLAVGKISDSILAQSAEITGDGVAEKPGCVRFSAVPAEFDRTHVHWYQSVTEDPTFLAPPCLYDGTPNVGTVTTIGTPAYGVLSDRVSRAIRRGAEDGGELGAYHDDWHLARLDAAVAKAEGLVPLGQRIFAHYDTRLMAPLPSPATE